MQNGHAKLKDTGFIAGALLLACLAVWGLCIHPSYTFTGMDFLNLLYPHARFNTAAFGSGEVPLWNWFTWNGTPHLAALQSAPLYPVMWLTLLLKLPEALQLNIFAHLFFAGVGVSIVGRKYLGLCTTTAVFAGIAFCCSGFRLGHVEQVNVIATQAYAPWLLLASLDVYYGRGAVTRLCILSGLAFLAGHPQDLVLAALIIEIISLLLVAFDWRTAERNARLKAWVAVQWGFAISAALVAAQLLPTQELGGLSERIWEYNDPFSPAVEWRHLCARFVPRYYNTIAGQSGQAIQFAEASMYMGMLTLPLFLVGMVACVRKRRTPLLVAVVIAWVVALNFAMGRQSVVAPLFFQVVGFLRQSRGAARMLNVETMMFALIAGVGLQWAVEKWKNFRLLPTVACALLIADFSVVHSPELQSLLSGDQRLRQNLASSSHARPEPNRLYRFMANDSDFYQDRRIGALIQRTARVQPNLVWKGAPPLLLDGYEEGLLPVRHYANFLRKYNRNLRQEKVDAALLAMLGSYRILTEYPLPEKAGDWTFRTRQGQGLNIYHSPYSSTWFVAKDIVKNLGPKEDPHRFVPPGQVPAEHPFSNVTPQLLNDGISMAGISVKENRTNSMLLSCTQTGKEVLFLQTPYPGWKIAPAAHRGKYKPLQRVSPVMSSFTPPVRGDCTLFFDPFSFRLGLFISVITLASLVARTLCRSMLHRQDQCP